MHVIHSKKHRYATPVPCSSSISVVLSGWERGRAESPHPGVISDAADFFEASLAFSRHSSWTNHDSRRHAPPLKRIGDTAGSSAPSAAKTPSSPGWGEG